MQRFVNNWAAELLAPAASTDLELTIDAGLAAQLVGVGADHYVLTLVEQVEGEPESGWEVVKLTAQAGGVLSVERGLEGTVPRAWGAGTVIEARVTAASLDALRAGSAAIFTGDGPPSAAPLAVGAHYIDGLNQASFIALATSAISDWQQVGGGAYSEWLSFDGLGAPLVVGAFTSYVAAYSDVDDFAGGVTFVLPNLGGGVGAYGRALDIQIVTGSTESYEVLLDFTQIAAAFEATSMTVLTNVSPPSLDETSAAFSCTGDVLFTVRATIESVFETTRSALLLIDVQPRPANGVTVPIP